MGWGITSGSVLRDWTASLGSASFGGALYLGGSAAVFDGLTLTQNAATRGGALYLRSTLSGTMQCSAMQCICLPVCLPVCLSVCLSVNAMWCS